MSSSICAPRLDSLLQMAFLKIQVLEEQLRLQRIHKYGPDETPVDVQMHDKRGKNHQAYLWQYGQPGGSVIFGFQLGRGRAGPKQFLEDFEGLLQTGGYIGYEKAGGPKMVHAAC